MGRLSAWLAAALLLTVAMPGVAQQNIDRSSNPAEITTPIAESPADRALRAAATAPSEAASPQGQQTSATPTFPKVWCGDISDPETKKVCWRAYRASLDYYATGLAHRARVFRWQHYSTIAIFFTVLGLVGTGIVFAWQQFERDKNATTQTLKISTSGVELTSTFLGVVILTLSLGFFYLYLAYVYPIHELF